MLSVAKPHVCYARSISSGLFVRVSSYKQSPWEFLPRARIQGYANVLRGFQAEAGIGGGAESARGRCRQIVGEKVFIG